MALKIDNVEIRDIVEINMDSMQADKEDVNDLIVSDLLVNMGYNRKKDKNVKKISDENIDWKIIHKDETGEGTDAVIAVKVYALGAAIESDELDELGTECIENKYDILVTVAGDKLTVYRVQVDKLKLVGVKGAIDIDLKEPLDETSIAILEAISKEEFNLSKIDNIVSVPELAADELASIIKNSADDIAKIVNTVKNTDVYSGEIITGALEQILSEKQSEQGTESEAPKAELASIKCKLSDAEETIASLKQEIEGKVEEVETLSNSLRVKDEELNSLRQDLESKVQALVDRENTIIELKEQCTSAADNKEGNEELEGELESLKSKLELTLNELEEIRSEREALKAELADKESNEQTEELGNLKSELSEKQDTIDNLTSNIESIRTELADSNDSLEAAQNNIKELEEKIESLEAELESRPQQSEDSGENTDELKEKLTNAEEQMEILEEKVKEYTAKIDELEKENQGLKESAQSNSTSSGASAGEGLSQDLEFKYKEKIRELTVQLSNTEEEKETIEKELNALKEQVNELSGSERKAAEELLGVIGDSPNGKRMYVAVINKELMQYDEIHTFVGRTLQKLYDIVGLQVQQYIFAGDMYKLNSDSKYNDLLLGTNYYDIEFNSTSEINELNNLRIVFSHFSDVIFLCKTVGVGSDDIKDRKKIKQESVVSLEVDSDAYIDEDNNIQETQYSSSAFSEGFEDNEQQSDEYSEGFGEYTGEEDGAYESEEGEYEVLEGEREEYLVGCQISAIDSIIWTEDNIDFKAIKYVGTDSQCVELPSATFNISNATNNLDMVVCKCIDSLLAVAAYVGDSNLIARLKQKNFSEVNSVFKIYTDEYRGYPRINGTKYAIVDIESVQQAAAVIADVYTAMQISVQNLFLWIQVEADQGSWIKDYEIPEDAIALSENINYEPDEGSEDEIGICIIKGDFPNSMVITKNSLRVHKEILVKPLAIKTKYMQKTIAEDSDIVEIISNMITVARGEGVNVNYSMFGNLLGTNKKLLSSNIEDVGDNPYEIDLVNEIVYCARMEEWQITHSLIRIHTILFNNTSIAIKNNVNLTALEFYDEGEFKTVEPSLAFAVKSFTRYIQSCIRKM